MFKKCLVFLLAGIFFLVPITFARETKSKKKVPDIVFPLRGQSFPFITHSFIFGSTFPGSCLMINGEDVPVHQNGAFFSFVPVKEGKFTFSIKSESSEGIFEEKRNIVIARRLVSSAPDSREIQRALMLPNASMILSLEDEVVLRFMGTPGKQAFFHFKGSSERFPMEEVQREDYEGVYEAVFQAETQSIRPGSIVYELFDGEKLLASRENPHMLQFTKDYPYEIYEVNADFVKARNAPGGGYKLLLHKGMRLRATGVVEPYLRLALSENSIVYVDKKDLNRIEKTGILKQARIGNMRVFRDEKAFHLKASCARSIPFRVEEHIHDQKLSLFLYSVQEQTDRLFNEHYQEIKDITFSQEEADVLRIDMTLPFKPVWGWDIVFSEGRMDFLVKRPPDIRKEKPLKGLTLCLDPGHNPGPGAVGPMRLEERNINWIIAENIRKILQKAGAHVVMTRENKKDQASLRQRVAFAIQQDSCLFISLHNNSVSNGKNPYDVSGTETYFYTPASRILADYIHQKVAKATGLSDRGVHFGNFAVLRNSCLPCVLVEFAYIIVPEQERLLMDKAFQESISAAVVDGIKMFLLKEANII